MAAAMDRRAAAVGVEIDSFGSCLQQSLEGDEWAERFETACAVISQRVKSSSGNFTHGDRFCPYQSMLSRQGSSTEHKRSNHD